MDKFQQFEQAIENMGYITNPYDLIYDLTDNPNSYELIEFIRMIHYHNQNVTEKVEIETKTITSIMASSKIVEQTMTPQLQVVKEEIVDNSYTYPQDSQVDQVIQSLEYFKTVEEFSNNIKGINEQGIYKIKLYLLKLIIETTKAIKRAVLVSPISDLTELQLKILNYQEFLNILQEKQIETTNEIAKKEKVLPYNIIIVPDTKSSTYLFEDITSYPESYEEITTAFDNIMSQQMFSSKSIKQIRDKNEKLYEYKRKNGIRVLFIKNGSNIFVTSLFYKDKQRSTKIDQQYEEAIKRYNIFINSEIDFTSVEFQIEQKEAIGSIYGEIESGITYRKKGDIND